MRTHYNDYDKLTRLGGSFWNKLYEDGLFRQFVTARTLIERQTAEERVNLRALVARSTTPTFQRILWQPIKLLASAGLVHRLDADLVSLPLLTDYIQNPTITLIEGLDYFIEDSRLILRVDPFKLIDTIEPIFDEAGNEIDQSVTLWAHNARRDSHLLEDCWGALLGLAAPSSATYRELLCIVYDAIIGGTTELQLRRILGLLYGGLVCRSDETVETVASDADGEFVVTDKHVYRGTGDAKTIVTVGDKLVAGDGLFDTVQFYNGQLPATAHELPIPAAMLDPAIGSELVFPNKEVSIVQTDGRDTFEIKGQPSAVQCFWNILYNRCPLLKFTTTINPAKFILANALPNAFICVVKRTTTDEYMRIDRERVLRTVIPPYIPVIMVLA